MSSKRLLTPEEIEFILDTIKPNPLLPKDVALQLVENDKNLKRASLKKLMIYPEIIPRLKEKMKKLHDKSIMCPGESVGIHAAQTIGENSTQANLNTFHQAGTATSIATSSTNFEEMINATKDPKNQTCIVYFKENNKSIEELRKQINSRIVEINLSILEKSYELHIDKNPEPWYDAFYKINDIKNNYKNCISVKIKMEIIFEYQLTLKYIADKISSIFSNELVVIYSPDCFGQIDIFCDTDHISIPDKIKHLITPETKTEMCLEDVVYKAVKTTQLCGIKGIKKIRYVFDNDTKTWFIETQGNNFKKLLTLFDTIAEKTITSNIWNILETLGIEAMRKYMIQSFGKILGGINYCHYSLLVDQMTFGGSAASVTRHTIMADDANAGPIAGSTFEQPLQVLLNGAQNAYNDHIKSISAAIAICAEVPIGTNYGIELYMQPIKIKTKVDKKSLPIIEEEHSPDIF